MTPKEQQQLKKHDTDIAKLLKAVDVLIRRSNILEKENNHLKRVLARTNNMVSTLESRLK
jgi:regulator of replication initiation timing